jgi:hypothetical protein
MDGRYLTLKYALSMTSFILFALLGNSGRVFWCRCVVALGRKMSESKSGRRVNITFLVKLKQSAKESFQLLTEATAVTGQNTPSQLPATGGQVQNDQLESFFIEGC